MLQGTDVIDVPEVRYVRNGGVSLAYQVVGNGPIDILEMTGSLTHLEAKWEEPGLTRSVADLARFARVIVFDRRGIGLSDRIAGDTAPTLNELVGDVGAVMDAAGSREAVMLGVGDGAKIAAAFAALHPERTRALVLYNSLPLVVAEGEIHDADALIDEVERGWGTGVMASVMGAQDLRAYFARIERRACTPRAAAIMFHALLTTNLEELLPSIRVPTLVQHYRDHPGQPAKAARRTAAMIPGARYVEVPGWSADGQLRERRGLAAAIEEFLTGSASVTDTDRFLAAVLFTDIVRSTERAAELGDHRWREVLDEHDRRVRRAVEAAGGRFVKSTGDGVLASFDGVARAVRCAQALVDEAQHLGVPVRAGIHVGECERRGDDIGGMTVHVAARVLARAGINEVLVTSTAREALIGAGIDFDACGTETLRGVPGTWSLFVLRAF
jgi:class 3 adenylate cyclase